MRGLLAGYRQNLGLLGPAGIGKTTLLKRLIHERFIHSASLVVLYLEIKEEEDFSEWASRFAQSLLYGLLRAKGVKELPLQFSQLLVLGSSFAPETIGLIKRLIEKARTGRAEEIFDSLWDTPSRLHQETGLPCLVILDEFQGLNSLPVKDPFGRLGRKIMVQNTTLYLVASSQSSTARSILREGLSLLFGQFEILEMGPLGPEASLKAIRAVLAPSESDRFMESVLMDLTQGDPASLDLLLQGWIDRGVSSGMENPRSLLDLLESLLLEPHGSLRNRFEGRLKTLAREKDHCLGMKILFSIAGGMRRLPQMVESVDRSKAQVVRALRTLERERFVTKEGVFYRILDPLFQLWMVSVYPALQGVDLSDATQVRARFRDAAWTWMARIQEAIRQPIEESVRSLLKAWNGETVWIEGRRMVLPSFHRMELVLSPSGRRVLMAHRMGSNPQGGLKGAGKSWLVIPWAGPLEEMSARGLVQELDWHPFKAHRKFLLGPYPVEANARLVLKASGIHLGDLKILNDLLDRYGLVRIPFPCDLKSVIEESPPEPREVSYPSGDSALQGVG